MPYNLSISKELVHSAVIQKKFLTSIGLLGGGSKQVWGKPVVTASMIFGEMDPKK